jgi:hypothetical protein
MKVADTLSIAVRISGFTLVLAAVFKVRLTYDQCATVSLEEQLEVLRLLHRLAVLVPDDLER